MGNDGKFVFFLILAIIFFAIYLFSRKVENYNPETFPAIGIIDRINQNDRGDYWYYIKFPCFSWIKCKFFVIFEKRMKNT